MESLEANDATSQSEYEPLDTRTSSLAFGHGNTAAHGQSLTFIRSERGYVSAG